MRYPPSGVSHGFLRYNSSLAFNIGKTNGVEDCEFITGRWNLFRRLYSFMLQNNREENLLYRKGGCWLSVRCTKVLNIATVLQQGRVTDFFLSDRLYRC